MFEVEDEELYNYRNQIGTKEYHKQYSRLYTFAKQSKRRYSNIDYDINKNKISELKEKYKNGVTKDIINEMLNIKE